MTDDEPDFWTPCWACRAIAGEPIGHIVAATRDVLALLNPFPLGPGHVLVVPRRHVANLYELPEELAGPILAMAARVARAAKSRLGADGVTLRQNNEPASDQHLFHFHLHVIPRFAGDAERFLSRPTLADQSEQQPMASQLRAALLEGARSSSCPWRAEVRSTIEGDVPRRPPGTSAQRYTIGDDANIMNPKTASGRAAAAYNAAADCYDTAALSLWDRFGRRTVERLSLRAGARVLDVCCGSGSSALPAAARVGPTGQVLGVDLADKLLAQARAKAGRAGLANTEFELGDLETLDGITRTFDAVVCVFGIFFSPDMAAAVARLWRLVRPGGVLAVTTWGARLFEPANSVFWEAVRREAPALHQAFHPWDRIAEPSQLRALFDEAGVPMAEVSVETGAHPLRDPADWWTIVLGSGYRGTVKQLSTDARERVREYTLGRLRQQAVRTIEANVLYATARRAAAV